MIINYHALSIIMAQVIFTDEQTLLGPFLSSSDEDDQIEDIEEEEEEETQVPSAKASTEVLDNSQPESVS